MSYYVSDHLTNEGCTNKSIFLNKLNYRIISTNMWAGYLRSLPCPCITFRQAALLSGLSVSSK